jgi:ribose transport system substrate-binding protein
VNQCFDIFTYNFKIINFPWEACLIFVADLFETGYFSNLFIEKLKNGEFMKKRLLTPLVVLVCLVIIPTFAFGGSKKHEVAFLLKSTAQDFWDHIRIGGNNYAKEHSDKVEVKFYGAEHDMAVGEALGILENIITTAPDGIVMASVNPETMATAIERAVSAGIKVVTINDSVKQFTDMYSAEFVSDNYGGGVIAAQYLVDYLKENNKPLKGKVAVHSAIAGHPDLTRRCKGFEDTLKKIAPKIEVLEWRYYDVDTMKEVSLTQDVITVEGDDLIAIYVDAGMGTIGAQRVLVEQEKFDDICLIGWDSSPEAVEGLSNGWLKGLVLQDPFGMGYMGMDSVVKILDGKKVKKDNPVPMVIFTKKDMGTKEANEFLDPTLKEIK